MPDLHYPLNTLDSYIRVQTNYYKKCLQPTIHGEYKEIWMPWSAEMLKQDLTKSAFRKVQKFDGFSCVPSHHHYQETIRNFYTFFQSLEWKAETGSCDELVPVHYTGRYYIITQEWIEQKFDEQLKYG